MRPRAVSLGADCRAFQRSYLSGTGGNAGNDSSTKSLLHFDGANGSSTFTDSNLGGSAKTWTLSGSPTISTAQSKFGGASGLFTDNYITTASHADFAIGTSDFTIDFWIRPTAYDNTYEDYVAIGTSGTNLIIGRWRNGINSGAMYLNIAGTLFTTSHVPSDTGV